jgi:hypothetical protein
MPKTTNADFYSLMPATDLDRCMARGCSDVAVRVFLTGPAHRPACVHHLREMISFVLNDAVFERDAQQRRADGYQGTVDKLTAFLDEIQEYPDV